LEAAQIIRHASGRALFYPKLISLDGLSGLETIFAPAVPRRSPPGLAGGSTASAGSFIALIGEFILFKPDQDAIRIEGLILAQKQDSATRCGHIGAWQTIPGRASPDTASRRMADEQVIGRHDAGSGMPGRKLSARRCGR